MVTLNAWLDGGSAAVIVVFCMIFTIFFLSRARNMKLRLLTVAAFMVLFTGFLWMGPFTDFMSLIINETNIDPLLYGKISYFWVAPALICAVYIGAELIIPEKKWYVVTIFLVLGLVFEFLLFFDTENTFNYNIPVPGSGDPMDVSFRLTSPTFLLIALFIGVILTLNGISFLRKSLQLQGGLRRKFLLLAATFLLFCVCAAIDSLAPAGLVYILAMARMGMVVVSILLYYGLKPT